MKALMVVLTAVVTLIVDAGTSSNSTRICLNAEDSYLWRTAPGTTFTVQWENPEGVPVTLQVVGYRYSQTYADLTETSQVLTLPPATDDASENVFTLTLTLGTVVKTAQLAVVRGVGAGGEALTSTCRNETTGDGVWAKFTDHAVLPIPAGTETFSINGQKVDTGLQGTAGWHLLRGIEPNSEATLVLDGVDVTVFNRQSGLFIVFR